MTLGQKLKYLRVEKDLTIRELANIFQVGRSTLSGYENDKSNPDYEMLSKLADYYGVSVDWLLGRTDDRQGYFMNQEKIPKELKQLGEVYIKVAKDMQDREMDPEDIQKILEFYQNMKK